MRHFFGLLIAVALLLVLSSCAVWTPGEARLPDEPELVLEPTFTPDPFEPLVDSELEPQCAHVWASRPLPEFTDLLQAAYRSAGIDGVQADVSAYGENCVDVETKQIVRFMTMRSEFYLSVIAEDLESKDALSRQLISVMNVLQKFPADTFPGLEPNTVIIRFESGGEAAILSFRMDEFEQAIEDGLRGAALYEMLD
jgi:hypothetical protein